MSFLFFGVFFSFSSETKSQKKHFFFKMPRAKKRKPDEPAPVYTFYEFIDANALQFLYEMHLPPEHEQLVVSLQETFSKSPSQRLKVDYMENEKNPGERLSPHGLSVQKLKGWMRRALTWRNYIDLDFQHCGPTIRFQLFRKHLPGLVFPQLCELVGQREEFYKRLPVERKKAKEIVNAVLSGRSTDEYPELAPLKQEIRKACKKLVQLPAFSEKWDFFQRNAEKNHVFAFLCHICLEIERKALDALIVYCQDQGWSIGTLAYDGLTVERPDPYEGRILWEGETDPDYYGVIAQRTLDNVNDFIFQQTDYKIKVVEKSTLLTHEEMVQLHTGPRVLKKIKPTQRMLIYLLNREASSNRLKRQGLFVMRKHKIVPQAWVQAEDAEDWITTTLFHYPEFQTAKMKDLLEWFKTIESPDMMFVKENPEHVAFLDCRFDLATLQSTPWSEISDEIACTHFFESNMQECATPAWDKMLKYQLSDEGYRMMHVMLGRLFYPLKRHDNWQVFPFLLGDGNTGKSTILHIIRKMFSFGSVGVISGTQEKTFGFQSLHNKRCILVYDLSENFHQQVDQSQYQSMISGDEVSVAVKNGNPVTLMWTTPIMMSGNSLPNYKDKGGNIARRVFTFEFRNPIDADIMDTNLQREIEEQELVSLFLRCVRAYRSTCAQTKGKDFWKFVAGPEFEEMKRDTSIATNKLSLFLDEGNERTRILNQKGAFVQLQHFQEAFNAHLESLKLKPSRVTDYQKFKERGFEVLRVNLCSRCDRPQTAQFCQCSPKPQRNRKFIIRHMVIYDKCETGWSPREDGIQFIPRLSCLTAPEQETSDQNRNKQMAELFEQMKKEDQEELQGRLMSR